MSSYGAVINDDEKEKLLEQQQVAVTHWHLIPTCVAFAAFYTYVSIGTCLVKMRNTEMTRSLIYVNVILVFMFLWSYLTAAMTNPGMMNQRSVAEEGSDRTSRWFCKKCKVMKPLRCHHCRRCNRCVVKMDHHCYWINNCVGLYNMKYFYLTLLYGATGTTFMFSIYLSRWTDFLYYDDIRISNLDIAFLTLATLFIVAHGSTVIYLFVFHSYLLTLDRTSVEHRCCKGVKPGCNHDKGLIGNLTEVFGPLEGCILYMIPVASVRCSSAERKNRKELIKLYSDHALALPYFENTYGYSDVIESESPVLRGRRSDGDDNDSEGSVML